MGWHYTHYYTSFGPPAFFVWLASILVYFIPSIIAHRRRHKNRLAIYALNLLLPGVGWVIALVWSLTDNVE